MNPRSFAVAVARQVFLLGRVLRRVEEVTRVARGALGRDGDDQHLAVVEREPCFPLGVRKGRRVRLRKRLTTVSRSPKSL